MADTEKIWSQLLAGTPIHVGGSHALIATIESDSEEETQPEEEKDKEKEKEKEDGGDKEKREETKGTKGKEKARWRQAVAQFKERVLALSTVYPNSLVNQSHELIGCIGTSELLVGPAGRESF